jgi:hypothetical protein
MGEVGCLKDGNFQNLLGENALIESLGHKLPVVSITSPTYEPTVSQSGTIFTLNKEDGIEITLPTAEAGLVYEFYVETPFTSGNFSIDASDSDKLQGLIMMAPSAKNDYSENTLKHGTDGPAIDDTKYLSDTDRTGRLEGTHLIFKCVGASTAAGANRQWLVSGHAVTSGDIGTPFRT